MPQRDLQTNTTHLAPLLEQGENSPTHSKYLIAGLLAANIIIRLIIALRPLSFIDGLTIPDDAYLSLTIARNIAQGLGPWYGTGYTNGFQPLYVFMMAPVYLIVDDPITAVHVALVRLTIFDTLSLFILFRMVASNTKSAMTPVIIAVAWILNPYIISTTLNGLETVISFFFIISSFAYVLNKNHQDLRWRNITTLGILLGMSILARIDNVFLAFTILSLVVRSEIKRSIQITTIMKHVALISLTTSIIILPWFVYSYVYTGELFPISGKAVRLMSLASFGYDTPFVDIITTTFIKAFDTLYHKHQLLIILLGLFMGGLIAFKKKTIATYLNSKYVKPYGSIVLFSMLLFIAYTCYILTYWYYNRYLFPLILPLLFALAIVVDMYHVHITNPVVKKVFYPAVILFLIIGFSVDPQIHLLYTSTDTTSQGYMNLGVWARSTFKDSTIIGSSQSGALGYFAKNLTVVNLDGVVNSACYQSLVDRKNIEYIRKAKVAYVVGWRSNIDFIVQHSTNFKKEDLMLEGTVRGFTSWGKEWYLVKINYGR